MKSLPIIHHLHRTGGTLIAKCVASLPDIALLSEVNPAAPRNLQILNPIFQASFWLKLFPYSEAESLSELPFAEKIQLIANRAESRGDTLVLRDWAYADFFGAPYVDHPSGTFGTADTLRSLFKLRQIVTVRHPMDQWLSWVAYRGAASAAEYGFADFARRVADFAKRSAGIPVIRYEDFVANPNAAMRRICDVLKLDFDPVYRSRWPYYHQITGDDNDRASGDWTIAQRPRRQPNAELAAEAACDENYACALTLFGYDH